MARSWANRYALETRPGKLVHHSTYRDLPRAMLGERFWADAEHLQRTNPAAFRHEYGGEVVGSGAAVFGIFDDENAARSAVAALKNGYKQGYLCKPTHGGPRVTVRRLFGAKK